MAKLVDALPSGGSVRKDVLVRIQFRAQNLLKGGFFYKLKLRISISFSNFLFIHLLFVSHTLYLYCALNTNFLIPWTKATWHRGIK